MKKLFKLAPIALFGFCLVFNSCSREEDLSKISNDDNRKSSELGQREFYGYTSEDFTNLGNVHNALLSSMQANFNNQTVISPNSLRDIFISNYGETYFGDDYSAEDLWQYSVAIHDKMQSYDYNLQNWNNNPFSVNENHYINLIMSKIDFMDKNEKSYSWFQNEMNNVRTNISSNEGVSSIEKEGLFGVIAVSEKSVLYWAPVSLGGEGNFDKLNNQNSVTKGYWSRAGRADAAVSAGFMLSSSILFAAAVTAPPAGLGFLVAWGVSAGVGSALGGFLK